MQGSPLHWVFFLYFTVHAHEDRHGSGVIYQLGDNGHIPNGAKVLICKDCDWIACDQCIVENDSDLKCFQDHTLEDFIAEGEGLGCDQCGRGSHPAHYIEKHMGGVLEKYFPKPPDAVLQRIFTEAASHWNYTLCSNGSSDFFAVNGECAINLAEKFEWDDKILLDVFKSFVNAAEKDKVMVAGERALLDSLADVWQIQNPEKYFSDDVEYREPPQKTKIEFDDAGDPICPDCGGHMGKSFMCGASITFGPGGITQAPLDNDQWSCDDCGYSLDLPD